MSSFREAFTKDQKRLLEYDDNAAVYFLSTILICIILPWTIRFVCTLIFPHRSLAGRDFIPTKSKSGCPLQTCNCATCISVRKQRQEDISSSRNRLLSWSCIIQFSSIIILTSILVFLLSALSTVSEIQKFDPFEILDVGFNADSKVIKKAFRTLSLRHHPDKNPNDPSAAAKFVMISKAYMALTDEDSRRNYERYGNPDGPGLLEVGIGLPRLLVDERNQGFVLAILLLFLLFLIPLGFLMRYQTQKDLYPNGVRVETIHFIGHFLNENVKVLKIVEFLAASAEGRELAVRDSEMEVINKLQEQKQFPKQRQFSSPVVNKNYILLLSHMHRLHDKLTPAMQKDLEILLGISMKITESMLEMAFMYEWFEVIANILIVRRCLLQAVKQDATTITGYDGKVTGGPDFLDKSNDEKMKALKCNPKQLEDLEEYCRHIPRIKVDLDARCKGETSICEGDLITISVRINRINLADGTAAGPIHAPFFPNYKFEEFWIFLRVQSNGRLVTYSRLKNTDKINVIELKFLAPKPGIYVFEVLVMSDAFFQIDLKKTISIKVASKEGRQFYIHPDDLALDMQQQSLFNQLTNTKEDDGNSEDSDDE